MPKLTRLQWIVLIIGLITLLLTLVAPVLLILAGYGGNVGVGL